MEYTEYGTGSDSGSNKLFTIKIVLTVLRVKGFDTHTHTDGNTEICLNVRFGWAGHIFVIFATSN